MLKTHMAALPTQVQEAVARLTAPEPASERDIATKLKGQVSDLKNLYSIARKAGPYQSSLPDPAQ